MNDKRILESNIKDLQKQLADSHKRILELNTKISHLQELNANLRIIQPED
jgi:regulator of replication initiation timing